MYIFPYLFRMDEKWDIFITILSYEYAQKRAMQNKTESMFGNAALIWMKQQNEMTLLRERERGITHKW